MQKMMMEPKIHEPKDSLFQNDSHSFPKTMNKAIAYFFMLMHAQNTVTHA